MINNQEKIILADQFLRKEMFLKTIKEIKKQKYNKIVIIGGSHSGFSAAWLLLNGPATFNSNNSIDKKDESFPEI